MNQSLIKGGLGLVLAGLSSLGFSAATQAGGAYCTPEWRPEHPSGNCSSQIAISPGNDSRVNLFLLMQDRAGADGAGFDYPDNGWETFYGRNFFDWGLLLAAWYPEPDDVIYSDYSDYSGTRCQTIESGEKAFLAALSSGGGIGVNITSALSRSRGKLADVCKTNLSALSTNDGGVYFPAPPGSAGKRPAEYYAYLEASASFYGGEWDRAARIYSELATLATDPWVKETAQYMVARNHLNHAIESGEDQWGDVNLSTVNNGEAKMAEQGLQSYLSLHPDGRYASSAKGLIRKALWLQQDQARLAPIYAELVNSSDVASIDAAILIEEVDAKLLVTNFGDAELSPYLRAAHILMEMRVSDDLTAKELSERSAALETHEVVFADHPDIYTFLQANHAFYAEKDYRAVLRLLPDAARETSYTPLNFSRQHLRGLALHALGDRNEEGFWLDLIEGANGIWQRPAVELPLARLYEQNGQLDKVFADESPITDGRIRRMLLGHSAGPDILKAQMRDASAPASERSFALFTGLLKQLQHNDYAGFLDDYALIGQMPAGDQNEGLWNVLDVEALPLDFFTDGTWSDGYSCPDLQSTVRKLAANAGDLKAQICLGDFYRLNGFDQFRFAAGGYQDPDGDARPAPLAMREFYPGEVTPRHDIYTAIIADRRASSNDKAYALFRAVRCYAPTGANSCGGPGVAEDVRARWFRQLKRDYPDNQWSRDLEYYW